MAKKKLTEQDFPVDKAEEIDLGMDAYPDQNWDEDPVIVGTVEKIRPTKQDRNGEKVDVRYMVVDNGAELVKVWESANLTPAFDKVRAGDQIMVRFLGKEELSGGRTMRTFQFHIHAS